MTTLDQHAVAVLRAIQNGAHSYPAIEQATGLTTARVHWRLQQLRRAGLVAMGDGKHGTIRALTTEEAI